MPSRTPSRFRDHAPIEAISDLPRCLPNSTRAIFAPTPPYWPSVYGGQIAFEYTVPGIFDRAGNIKFQDFLQFSISASLITQGRAYQLYDDQGLGP